MYQFISPKEIHLDPIVPLLASTGYWKAGLSRNKLQLPTHEFIRDFIVKPNLPLITIIVRAGEEDTPLGLLLCGTTQEIDDYAADYGKHMPHEVMQLFKNLFVFEIPESYHIANLAVSKTCRGQGLGMALMRIAEEKWRQSQLETLSLYTFSCQTDAMRLYLKAGMMVTQVLTVDERVPSSCLLYFEKNTRTANLQNYFETPAYHNLVF